MGHSKYEEPLRKISNHAICIHKLKTIYIDYCNLRIDRLINLSKLINQRKIREILKIINLASWEKL
jgi:hypothetical protein